MEKIKVLYVLRDAKGGMRKHVEILVKGLNKNKFEVILACAVSATLATIFTGNRNIISTIHNFPQIAKKRKRVRLSNVLAGLLLRYNQKVVVVSEALGNMVNKTWGIPRGKLKVIYNGINIREIYEASLQTGDQDLDVFKQDSFKILNASRLVPEKGVDTFIEAAAYLKKNKTVKKDIHFLIAGDGPDKGKLERQVHKLGLEDTVFLLDHRDDIYKIMSKSDLIVLSSRNEGLGIILLETLSLKKPVVASNVGGIREIIRDTETGYLVKPGDVKGLAERIAFVLNDYKTTTKITAEGYEMLKRHFTMEKMVADVEELYIQLTK